MFEEKNCPNCGNPVRNEAVFCLDCGQRIDSVKEGPTNQPKDKRESTDKIKALSTKTVSFVDDMISEDLLDPVEFGEEAYFEIVRGNEKGARIPLNDRLLVGRKKRDNGFCLNDPYISRDHLMVVKKERDFYLKNLSQTNGTKVNGGAVDEHKLSHGDVVEIGFTTMTFHLKSQ